jgi:hypothetical protein
VESNWVHWARRPAPGEYEDGEFGGMMIGRGNRSTRKKLPQSHFVLHKSHFTWPGANPGRCGGKPTTNCLSYDMAFRHYVTSRKVSGSIPDEVTGFFNLPNPSSRTYSTGVDSASNIN